uniref:Pannexin n=1 Tax=Hucho hucho TaxID=62062 RepID=A0A4W5NVC1_9TELE
MAIAHVATEYVFSDFLLKDPTESKYKGVRWLCTLTSLSILEWAILTLSSIPLCQNAGTQISCFFSMNFSQRQAAYVDSFCWPAVQEQQPSFVGVKGAPPWLHKFFPYILLLLAILMYIPGLFWRFTDAPHLSSDLNFIMEELDHSYNRAIRLAKNLDHFQPPSTLDYLVFTLLTLLLACLYLGYYIRLASFTNEFACDVRTGLLRNNSAVAVQCKLVAVGVFRLLSYINLGVYILLSPLVVYATLGSARQSSRFLWPYKILPAFGALDLDTPFYNDFSMYLLFLEDNLSELKSYKCLQVLELLREGGSGAFDTMCLLQTLGQVKTDVVDGKKSTSYQDNNVSILGSNPGL